MACHSQSQLQVLKEAHSSATVAASLLISYLLYCCRKRQLYACQDISTLVSKAGISAEKLAAAGARWSELEVFDDTTHESRTAEQWVPSIPGKLLAGKQPGTLVGLGQLAVSMPLMC
jgi:hypothetical protein